MLFIAPLIRNSEENFVNLKLLYDKREEKRIRSICLSLLWSFVKDIAVLLMFVYASFVNNPWLAVIDTSVSCYVYHCTSTLKIQGVVLNDCFVKQSLTIENFAAQSEKTRKVGRYIVYLMWEARKTKEENGFIYLRAFQLSYSVLR